MKKLDKARLPVHFGVFTPYGHLVLGFATDVDMARANESMVVAGIPARAVTAFKSEEVIAEIERMRSDPSWVGFFLNEFQMMDAHLRLAREGGGFLVVYVPDEAATHRVIGIAKRFQMRIAHKYNRLTLEHIAA